MYRSKLTITQKLNQNIFKQGRLKKKATKKGTADKLNRKKPSLTAG